MQDPVRLSDEDFRSTYQQAFESWARIHRQIANEPGFPILAFFPAVAQGHPALPRTLELKHDSEGLLATGFSTWSSSGSECSSSLPSFKQPLHMKVATAEPNLITIQKNAEKRESCAAFADRDNCYLAVLVLAWSYILSARWTETLSETCTLTYTQSQSQQHTGAHGNISGEEAVEIVLEDAGNGEVRWWAAVLAPGQGWKAQIQSEDIGYLSPWSVHLQTECKFVLRHNDADLPSSASAATFRDASDYLKNFCRCRNIVDQSLAALSAVLLIPAMGSMYGLSLPFPSIRETGEHCSSEAPNTASHHDFASRLTCDERQIDKLIALSCNIRGIKPMLLSTFYEPSIECNAVTPWLQGSLAAIEQLAGSDSHSVVRMCMERVPAVAFLWLGVFVLSLHQSLLRDVRFGRIPIDLHSAAWSRTTQSFIQERTSEPILEGGVVSRADECKILFLAQAQSHNRLPLCQWKPFGTTSIENTDLEIQNHRDCEHHRLRYEGVSWRCQGGIHEHQASLQHDKQQEHIRGESPVMRRNSTKHVPVSFEGMNRNKEAISENATRNIFAWLRPDGYALGEANIWKHDWFQTCDSDDDEVSEDKEASIGRQQSSGRVKDWLSDLGPDVKTFDGDNSNSF